MEFPVYKMVLGDPGLGLKILSGVNTPAIMIDCVKFSKTEPIKLSISENYMFGPALIPDLLIERNSGGKKFFLSIDSDTIAQFHLRACKEDAYKNIDFNHNGQLFDGVTIDTMFRTHEKTVTSVKGYEDLPLGSLFIGAKIENQDFLNKVNSGEINGWSIDAMFKLEEAQTLTDKEVLTSIKEILNTL